MPAPAIIPAIAKALPAIGKVLGPALPYLTLGLFGKDKQSAEQKELLKQQAEVERLRRLILGMSISRQRGLDPLFASLGQGAFNMLPKHMTEGREFNYAPGAGGKVAVPRL